MYWKTPFVLLGLLAAGTNAAPPSEVGKRALFAPRAGEQYFYRYDDRPIEKIREAGGFRPLPAAQHDYSFYNHARGLEGRTNIESGLISASSSEDWVKNVYAEFMVRPEEGSKGTIYKIASGPNFMSTVDVLGGVQNLPDELGGEDQKEYLAKQIDMDQIAGHYNVKREKKNKVFGDKSVVLKSHPFHKNDEFDGSKYPAAVSAPDHRLAGFPPNHAAWGKEPFKTMAAQCPTGPILDARVVAPIGKGPKHPVEPPPRNRPEDDDLPQALGRPNTKTDKTKEREEGISCASSRLPGKAAAEWK